MELLTVLAYPIVFMHGKLRSFFIKTRYPLGDPIR